MTAAATTAAAPKFALYYRGSGSKKRKRPWVLHDTYDTEGEAWAWVHFCLRGSAKSKEVLIAYLADLQTNASPGSLSAKLKEVTAEPEAALVDHLAAIAIPKPAGMSK